MTKKMNSWKKRAVDFLLIITGSLIMSVGLAKFLIPHKITAGGVSGIATILYHTMGFPAGMTMLIINVPLFIIGVKLFGRNFGVKTLLGIVSVSFFTDLWAHVWSIPTLTDNRLLAAIYGGLLFGMGIGVVFKGRGTTGGSDIVARIIHKFTGISLGASFMCIDTIIILMTGIVFQDIELILFCLIILAISSKTVDVIIEGLRNEKGLFIISNKWEDISQRIMSELGRGVTSFPSQGLFTKTDKNTLYCIVTVRQVEHVRRIVIQEDPKAFVSVFNVSILQGEGFKPKPVLSDD